MICLYTIMRKESLVEVGDITKRKEGKRRRYHTTNPTQLKEGLAGFRPPFDYHHG